jgi:hypothetical protein
MPGGVIGNARLTAMTGMVLTALLLVEGLTVPVVRQFMTVHILVGLALIPPVALKLASTGYRFFRYYTGSQPYRSAGPPRPIPRIIAPVLVGATLGLLGTGVILLVVGPTARDGWGQFHTIFFVGWFVVMTVHFLAYIGRAPRLALADVRSEPHDNGSPVRGRLTRQSLVAGSLVLGLVLAVALLPLDASWVHLVDRFHDGQ